MIRLTCDHVSTVRAERVWVERSRGASTIGIQVPNSKRRTIRLRALLESPAYAQSQSPLAIALGTTATGEACMIDLATMPHLLIGGRPHQATR